MDWPPLKIVAKHHQRSSEKGCKSDCQKTLVANGPRKCAFA